jgi:hypothetical protein
MAELLPIARSDADAAAKVLALRGYIRMIGLAKAPVAERLEQCRQALAAAARPEEKRLALAALADVPHLGALKLVQANMADAAVANEAIAACVKIADALLPASPEEAGAALKELAENAKDPRVRDQAKGAMLKVRKAGGAIKTWLLSGPYLQKDKDGSALFDVAFPPESPDAKDVKWTVAPAGDDGKVDLNAALGGENRVAYLRTIVVAPKAGKAILAVGSDDGVKVFLNGKMVHGINASRGCEPDQDKVDIVLKEGDNDLLLKVVNFGDGWAAMARICGPQGQEMKELKYKTK